MWPEFFNLDALYRTKASMPLFQWNAQYQQTPTAEEAALVKREWWKEWEEEHPPACEYMIMSLDAAAEKHNRADYTALTTWGVLFNDEEDPLRDNTAQQYQGADGVSGVEGDGLRAVFGVGAGLVYCGEKGQWDALARTRRMGLVVQKYTPHRGSGDKMARLNSVADIIKSGLCWVPQTRWAEEVVEEIAGFPFMSNDDLVDLL